MLFRRYLFTLKTSLVEGSKGALGLVPRRVSKIYHLMVHSWFGSRWFGFLGSPYERDRAPLPPIYHQLISGGENLRWPFSNDRRGYNHPSVGACFLLYGEFCEQNAIDKNLGLNLNCPDGLQQWRKLQNVVRFWDIPLGRANSHLNHLAIVERAGLIENTGG